MPTAPETLLVTRSDDRVVVQLHRPAVRNAINQQMVDELHKVCAELEVAPRILIITGSNGVFASGADIAELRAPHLVAAASRSIAVKRLALLVLQHANRSLTAPE